MPTVTDVDGVLDHLPEGPMTAQQQRLAEALTKAAEARDASASGDLGLDDVGKSGKDMPKGRGRGKGKETPASGVRSTKPSPVIRAANGGMPKTILPSGMTIEAAAQLSRETMMEGRVSTTRSRISNQNGSSAQSSGNNGSGSSTGNADLPKTKTSHKESEQMRRDSLKAGFDDLRLLLPPIIIDPDSDEPLLPGSAPPRGPQRNLNLPPGSEDHPNRSVSKLALLKCSNEFIGRLNRRIERRDAEIQRLREEVRWLRAHAGVGPGVSMEAEGSEMTWVDLEGDLDEIEKEEINAKTRVSGVGASLFESPIVSGTIAEMETK